MTKKKTTIFILNIAEDLLKNHKFLFLQKIADFAMNYQKELCFITIVNLFDILLLLFSDISPNFLPLIQSMFISANYIYKFRPNKMYIFTESKQNIIK